MDASVKIIMAYALVAIGPAVGSYAVVKNSSKLTASLMGGVTKLGQRASKALSGSLSRYDKMKRNENRTKDLRYNGDGKIRNARKKFAEFSTGYMARQSASEENLKDARRKYLIGQASQPDQKFARKLAGPGASAQDVAMLVGRYQEEEDKLHVQAVNFARQAVSKKYNASGEAGRVQMAKAAQEALEAGDQVQLDALMSHAATAGADEFSDVYTRTQRGAIGIPVNQKPTAEQLTSTFGAGTKFGDSLAASNRYVYATAGADLGVKSRGVATMLQQGDATLTTDDALTENGIRVYYQKMSAEKVANFSSNTAKAAAEFLDTDVLKQLVYDPNTSKNVGTTAMGAYRKELAIRMNGGKQTKYAKRDEATGAIAEAIPPLRPTLTKAEIDSLPKLPDKVEDLHISE